MNLTALPLCSLDGCRCGTYHPRDRHCPDCMGSGFMGDGAGGVAPCTGCAATYRRQYTIRPAQRASDRRWLRDRARAREAAEDQVDVEAREWAHDQMALD